MLPRVAVTPPSPDAEGEADSPSLVAPGRGGGLRGWLLGGPALAEAERERLLSVNLLIGASGGLFLLLLSYFTSERFDPTHPLLWVMVGFHLVCIVTARLVRIGNLWRALLLALFCLLWASVAMAYIGPSTIVALFFVFVLILSAVLYGGAGILVCFTGLILHYGLFAVLYTRGVLPLEGSYRSNPDHLGYWVHHILALVTASLMIIGLVFALIRRAVREAEERAALRELERARDAFTHMVAHDVRNPLWCASMMVDSARAAGAGQPELEKAKRCIADSLELLGQMLDISRMRHGRMPVKRQEFDLCGAVRDVVEDHARTNPGKHLRVEGPQTASVHLDAALVVRAVRNLVQNALQHTGPNGEVVCRVELHGRTARIEVRDNGNGIASADLERVFEPFVRLKSGAPGIGIGLAFVREAALAQGGSVAAEPAPGGGSIFRMTFPRMSGTDARG